MELISIDHINEQYLKYNDRRGCRNWLKAKGLSIIKLGKKYFVKEAEFKAVLNKITNGDKTTQAFQNNSGENQSADYYDIRKDLMFKINEL